MKETNIGGKYAGIGMVLTKVDDKEVDGKTLEDICEPQNAFFV